MKYLGFDSNWMCWRTAFKGNELSYNGELTGTIHNFLTSLLYQVKHFGNPNVVFAFDSRKNIRKKIYPGYKDRLTGLTDEEKETRKQIGRQINLLRRVILPTMGFNNIFIQTGMEADDLLARLVRDNKNKFIIITGDEDMFQLVDECSWYNTKVLMNKKAFVVKYGILPRDWRLVKQIAGCTSDKVKGIFGVGEKTAIKYLKGNLGEHTIAYDFIKDGKDIIRKNSRVVNLPHPRTKPLELKEDNFSIDGLLAICDLYGFEKIANKAGEWEMAFK